MTTKNAYETSGDYVARVCAEATEVPVPREVLAMLRSLVEISDSGVIPDGMALNEQWNMGDEFVLACLHHGELVVRTASRGDFRLVGKL